MKKQTLTERGDLLTEKQDKSLEEKEKRKKKLLIIFLAFLLIAAAIYLVFCRGSEEEGGVLGNLFDTTIDSDAQEGGLTTRSDEEIQEELKRKLEESMMNISMNLSPVFYDGNSEGNLNIVNDKVNNFMQVIEIYRKDTEELIYKSGGIPVGSKIEQAKLDVKLPKGVYDCVAYFNAVNEETGEFIGKAGAELKITIEN